ncbi:hypothetical protein PFICI_04481 [Pestalotiopsis fici W106-1]|uniref:Atos-like conserved domain-containing protein n=1 Tax=Pestalotiopsis fici (strain W106-1 / CGMCC3.15140) TaxID=1229662 RepID=W3X977_PESFW|nr:uncharacterized protein PFICI_04481 [Pestalotiopsis fici W106-1]ETS82605.1 hypothetical protein PFICI_04481 [Pestalotiopsis fici W106-1]
MPFFQEDIVRRESAGDVAMSSPPTGIQQSSDQSLADHTLERRLSDESIRTELCDGPVYDETRPKTAEDGVHPACSDRAELIQRLKRGESPTWISRNAGRLSPFNSSRKLAGELLDSIWGQRPATPVRNMQSPQGTSSNSPGLLPPPNITPEKGDLDGEDERRFREGMSIERPRSALHSGDFTQENTPTHRRTTTEGRRSDHDRTTDYQDHHDHSWMATSPPRDFTPFRLERIQTNFARSEESQPGFSSLSSSLSSTNFFYQPPTSPLVQSESHEDLDLANPIDGIDINSGYAKSYRRHTLMSGLSGSHGVGSPSRMSIPSPSLRHEKTFPYQAHQPRRSLTSTPSFLNGTPPQTPGYLRSRRPSYSSDSSPMQHASMVGSYEESILRGRMSTTPSKPLDFVAQIGVLGLGKCKSTLRCPAHVTLPFPAVFYSYASSAHGRSKMEDGPSPYVGQIDLENGLPNQEEDARSKRKVQSRAHERKAADEFQVRDEGVIGHAAGDARRSQKQKRRSGSPRAPPGGSYRIPEKGQIQIIIKNPNKTAVKLFLVPYDLAGMEPGTKTFIRQRSYSAGPIIDNLPELKDTSSATRPTLRYLVHLHICCPSRGRYYLYKSIRVVFANRVPDGKEKLQNEITLPEPRFTPYKAIRVMHPPISASSGPGASLAAEKAFRRRSSGFYMGVAGQTFDSTADYILPETPIPRQHFSYNSPASRNEPPVEAVPLRLPPKSSLHAVNKDRDNSRTSIWSASSSESGHPMDTDANHMPSFGASMSQLDRYDKLSKGDVGYGGNPFSTLINGRPGTAEGLLSQRLRTLGVEAPSFHPSNDLEQ